MKLKIRDGQQVQESNVSFPVKPEPSLEELKTNQVAVETLKEIPQSATEKSWFGRMKDKVGNATSTVKGAAGALGAAVGAVATNAAINAVGSILAKKRDDAYGILEQRVENSGDIKETLKEHVGVVSDFLVELGLPGVVQSLFNDSPEKAQEMTQAITIAVLGNLARLTVKEGEKVSLSEFADRSMRYLINEIGGELNEIDKQIGNSQEFDTDLFKPAIERLLKNLLNTGRVEDYVLSYFTPGISEKIAKAYLPLKQWLSGESIASQGKPGLNIDSLKPLISRFTNFMVSGVSKSAQDEDIQVISKLTGEKADAIHNRIQGFEEAVTPLVKKVIPNELAFLFEENDQFIPTIVHTLVLHFVTNNISNAYKSEIQAGVQVPFETVMEELLKKYISELRIALEAKDNAGEIPAMQKFAADLIRNSLPDVPFLKEIFDRYQKLFTAPLSDLLTDVKEKLPKEGAEKEFKVQVRALLTAPSKGSEEAVPAETSDNSIDHFLAMLDGIVEKAADAIEHSLTNATVEGQLSDLFKKMQKAYADMGGVGSTLQDALRTMLWKSILRMVASAKVEGQPLDLSQLLNSILDRLINFGADTLPDYFKKLQNMHLPEEERLAKAKEIAKPLTDMLTEIEGRWEKPDAEFNIQACSEDLVKLLGQFSMEERQRRLDACGVSVIGVKEPKDIQHEVTELLSIIQKEMVAIPHDCNVNERQKKFALLQAKALEGIKRLANAEHEESVSELIKPIVDQMISLFISDNLERDLPFPDKFKKELISYLKNTLYRMAARGFINSTNWLLEAERNEERVQGLFAPGQQKQVDPTAAVKVCHMAGQFAQEAIPQQFSENGSKWVEELFPLLWNAIPVSAKNSASEKLLKEMMLNLFKHLGNASDAVTSKVWGFVGSFAEAAVLKLMAEMGSMVDRMETALQKGDAALLEKLLLQIIQETGKHFKVLSKEHKHYAARNEEALKKAFEAEGLLHPGMKEEQKDEVFKEWAAKVLAAGGLSEVTDLPAPGPAQAFLWDKLRLMLAPMLLSMLFDSIKDPHMVNNLMVLAMSSFDSALDDKKKPWKVVRDQLFPPIPAEEVDAGPKTVVEGEEPVQMPKESKDTKEKDQYQKDLELAMAELVQYLIGSRHSPLANFFLKFKKVRGAIGEASGEPMRGLVQKEDGSPLPFNQFLNTALAGIVEGVMPCERVADANGENVHWQYYDVDIQGKRTGDPLPKPALQHILPKTDEEKKAAKEREQQIHEMARNKATKGLPKVVRQQADIQLQALFYKPWQKFVASMVKFIRKIVRSKHENKAERIMRKFLWGLGRYFLAPLLLLATLPIWLPFRAILHSVLQKQGTKRAEDLAAQKVHANFFYRAFGTLIDVLAEGAKKHPQPV